MSHYDNGVPPSLVSVLNTRWHHMFFVFLGMLPLAIMAVAATLKKNCFCGNFSHKVHIYWDLWGLWVWGPIMSVCCANTWGIAPACNDQNKCYVCVFWWQWCGIWNVCYIILLMNYGMLCLSDVLCCHSFPSEREFWRTMLTGRQRSFVTTSHGLSVWCGYQSDMRKIILLSNVFLSKAAFRSSWPIEKKENLLRLIEWRCRFAVRFRLFLQVCKFVFTWVGSSWIVFERILSSPNKVHARETPVRFASTELVSEWRLGYEMRISVS